MASENVGPLCHCGHGQYEHYMCGAPWEMRCYRRGECGCQQYADKEFIPAGEVNGVRLRAAELRGDNRTKPRRRRSPNGEKKNG